jgi:hypothetical protein
MDGHDAELSHSDLSHLRLQDMTPAQRAELKRRYDHFVQNFRQKPAEAKKQNAQVRKWVPGANGAKK